MDAVSVLAPTGKEWKWGDEHNVSPIAEVRYAQLEARIEELEHTISTLLAIMENMDANQKRTP